VITDYETGGPDVKGVIGPDFKAPADEKKSFDDVVVTEDGSDDGIGRLPTEEERGKEIIGNEPHSD
jgi:hypothetical protein